MSIYAVNGKEPIAAWIPSLDTAGNGTTTLTDLVGSNNGTLTNMDAATDWVADTDAGGVRALDFDGVDDFVVIPTIPINSGSVSVSAWVRRVGSPFNVNAPILAKGSLNGDSTSTFALYWNSIQGWSWFVVSAANVLTIIRSTNVFPTGSWFHFVGVSSTVAHEIYLNGVLAASTAGAVVKSSSHVVHLGGTLDLGFNAISNGVQDDTRLFDQVLDAADVTALYAAGNGRGITFGGTIQTRRRRDLGGFGL